MPGLPPFHAAATNKAKDIAAPLIANGANVPTKRAILLLGR